ncbi:MAG: hypothetical protein AAB553_05830 [Patescibacteria group bacterium]
MTQEEEIKQFKHTLQTAEDVDPAFMDDEMKELRHFTLFTHLRTDEAMGLMLTRENLKETIPPYPPFTQEQQSMIYAGTVSVIEDKYFNKAKDVSANNLWEHDDEVAMLKVNALRNAFGHPSIPKFRDVLIGLKNDRAKYKEALEVLIDAHNRMNAIALKSLEIQS